MARRSAPSWFSAFLARYKRAVAVALALGLVAAGFNALLMFTSGYLISATAVPGISLFSIMVPIACVQLFGFGRPLARYLERLVSHDWVLKVTSDLRLMLYRGVEARTGDPARAQAVGEYLGILSDDIAHLQNLYLRVVFPTAIALLLAVGVTVVFGAFSVPFALVMLVVFLLVAFLLPLSTLLATRLQQEHAKELKARYRVKLVDDVLGSADWIHSRRSAEILETHLAQDLEIRTAASRIRMMQRATSLAGTLLLGAAICLVVSWSGGEYGGTPEMANYIAALTLGFFPLVEAFAVLPAAAAQVTVHQDAVGRLDEYSDGGASSSDAATPDVRDTRAQDARTSGCALVFEDVCYAYPNSDRPVLDGLSLSIAEGEKVAVLGKSGAGKSTLAQLALGTLAPSSGRVATVGKVGYLGQSPYLFNRSIRSNLTLDVIDRTDGELVDALDAVGLEERFSTLEDGLDTVIGETGVGFSGGEAHRIALARLLAADTPIVLVDEPFCALDPDTEEMLLDTILETCADRTLVVITHHLALVERFDRVVFVEDGRCGLIGAPVELAAHDERFAALVDFDRNAKLLF